MKINWVEIIHFGPFSTRTKVFLDPNVTVITGPNDCGKSLLLQAIYYAVSSAVAEEWHPNYDRTSSTLHKWKEDQELILKFSMSINAEDVDAKRIVGALPGDELIYSRRFNHASDITLNHIIRGENTISTSVRHASPPKAVVLPSRDGIRDIMKLNELSDAEGKLLKLAFGNGFSSAKHKSMSPSLRTIDITNAAEKLNAKLKEILPPDLHLRLYLHDVTNQGEELQLSVMDDQKMMLPVGYRGGGIKTLLKLLGALLTIRVESTVFTVVLIDEPETSLHADAQHALRRLLERISESPTIQVVYTTHSPSMINTMRPASIRLLERVTDADGRANTVVHHKTFPGNYGPVRSSLGITPADSLLYARVTIVVEGITEVRCLPQLLIKLNKGGIAGFDDIDQVLSEIHFLDGEGDSYSKMCRLAKSQKCDVIAFLDGDKRNPDKQLLNHPDIKIHVLPAGRDFETLVPEDVYLKALAKQLGKGDFEVNLQAFHGWVGEMVSANRLRESIVFSRKISKWIDEKFGVPFDKASIMACAVEEVAAERIDADPLRGFYASIRSMVLDK